MTPKSNGSHKKIFHEPKPSCLTWVVEQEWAWHSNNQQSMGKEVFYKMTRSMHFPLTHCPLLLEKTSLCWQWSKLFFSITSTACKQTESALRLHVTLTVSSHPVRPIHTAFFFMVTCLLPHKHTINTTSVLIGNNYLTTSTTQNLACANSHHNIRQVQNVKAASLVFATSVHKEMEGSHVVGDWHTEHNIQDYMYHTMLEFMPDKYVAGSSGLNIKAPPIFCSRACISATACIHALFPY